MKTFDEEEELLPQAALIKTRKDGVSRGRKWLHVVLGLYMIVLHIALVASLVPKSSTIDTARHQQNETRRTYIPFYTNLQVD